MQFFGKSSQVRKQIEFARDFEKRRLGKVSLIVCGETNILKLKRDRGSITDPFRILQSLKANGVKVVLNPIHTYMRRYEMALKRQAFSRGNRLVVSVWNRGFARESEACMPWQVFRNSRNISDLICEIENPVAKKLGVSRTVHWRAIEQRRSKHGTRRVVQIAAEHRKEVAEGALVLRTGSLRSIEKLFND